MARQLNPQQRRFIAAYQTGITATQAAIEAGYSAKSAKYIAHKLLHENPLVREELDRISGKWADEAEYNLQRFMQDLARAEAHAVRTNNANALVKVIELRGKAANLLREKVDITVERVDVNGALAEAKARLLRPMCDSAPAIEGEFVALPGVERGRSVDNESVEPPSSIYGQRLFEH
ncbi:terminase small subunit [Dyella sp. BiH032]|uniref:terminase small subunit n=1 Tax=Dyella sp. BiH032 TaxID=3075430 RepID=UPI002892980F|nr:terminase small subunit [Dyella sp. BiH032]WNL45630.1 terminase small subunit [Dyella sp. BiH032]